MGRNSYAYQAIWTTACAIGDYVAWWRPQVESVDADRR